MMLFYLILLCSIKSNHISIKLESNWDGRDLLIEVSEYFAQSNNLWNLLEYSFTSDNSFINGTDYAVFKWAKVAAENLLGQMQAQSLEVTLAMGTNVPALAVARQKVPSHTCEPFLILYGQIICDPENIPQQRKYNDFINLNIPGEQEKVYPGDHFWQELLEKVPVAVLYGSFGDERTADFHNRLKKLYPHINYIFRYLPRLMLNQRKVNLPGYSLVLSIKNTEYKTVDDSQIDDTNDDCGYIGDVRKEFDFNHLCLPNQNCSETHWKNLLDKSPKTKFNWKFGENIINYVIESEDKLAALSMFSSMFPSMDNVISGIKVGQKAKDLFKRISVERYHNEIPENVLYVNSQSFDLEDSNLFKLGNLLSRESRLMDALNLLGYSPPEIASLSTFSKNSEIPVFAVDYRKWATLQFLNDLEKESHQKWYKSVGRMLQLAMYYGFQPISMNFVTIIFVVKPSDPCLKTMLDVSHQIVSEELSVRFSFLFITDEETRTLDSKIWHQFRKQVRNYPNSAWDFLRNESFHELRDSDSESDRLLNLSTGYYRGSGIYSTPGILINGVPQQNVKISAGQLRKLIVDSFHKTFNVLVHDYYNGDYEDGDDPADYSLNKNTVFDRLNPTFLRSSEKHFFLDFNKVKNVRECLQSVPYQSKTGKIEASHTVWVVGDFGLTDVANVGKVVFNYFKAKKNYRLSFIHNNISTSDKFCADFYENSTCQLFVSDHLSDILAAVPGNKTLLVVDGKIYETISLVEEDMRLLDQITQSEGIDVSKLSHFSNDDVLLIKSIIDQFKSSKGDLSSFDHIKAFSVEPYVNEPFLTLQMFVNPFDFEAHQIITIVKELKDLYNIKLDVYINPVDKSENNRYLGYAFKSRLEFDENGSICMGPAANIGYLPSDTVFSASISTIHNWMVSAVRTPYDLDNIVFNKALDRLCALYRLEYIIVEGHCYDSTVNEYPAGLQLFLENDGSQHFDTIVMKNIGYFQLKANPGIWWLTSGSDPEGKWYNIKSVLGTTGSVSLNRMPIMMDSFHSQIITVEVALDKDRYLESNKDGTLNNIFASISSNLKSYLFPHANEANKKPEKVVNVFSLASGHLYERLLKVMMLSVINHTSSPVRFYFLKNFLSPSFKDFLPNFSRHYGFEYVLVEYVWPHWLRKQTTRQRIIWGYKILFLDVLFPLDVKRIIYLDADQTIRTDVKTLFQTNLEGAPYGFTPFCDNRPEMDSYRFWTSSYWTTVLAGRPYHISALFVVDLEVFRKLSVGDILREQYHILTVDPNNLANLDQDLPNSLMRHIPLYSLDRSWLWCETWCSGESKVKAKTIDLCNNPRTRESKLNSAFRIVPEWKDYDDEIYNFTKKLANSSMSSWLDEEL